jgi:hypothetical protein
MDAITNVPEPFNEPVHDYAPGSPERLELHDRLKELAAEDVELTMAIDGEHWLGGIGDRPAMMTITGWRMAAIRVTRSASSSHTVRTLSSARFAMQRRTMYARRSTPPLLRRRHGSTSHLTSAPPSSSKLPTC